MKVHKVKEGETLSELAQKYGTTVGAIWKENAELIENVNVIRVGWELKIPTPTPEKDYRAIGKQGEKCMRDIQRLESFQNLLDIM